MAFVQTRTIREERLDLVDLGQEVLRVEDCHEDGDEYNLRSPDKVREHEEANLPSAHINIRSLAGMQQNEALVVLP